jgi:hypothetical protein
MTSPAEEPPRRLAGAVATHWNGFEAVWLLDHAPEQLVLGNFFRGAEGGPLSMSSCFGRHRARVGQRTRRPRHLRWGQGAGAG